jgi:hypothetical protein
MKMGFAASLKGRNAVKQQKGRAQNKQKPKPKPVDHINVAQIGYAGRYVLNIQALDVDGGGVADVLIDIFDSANPAQPIVAGLKTSHEGGVRYPEEVGQIYNFTEREKTLIICASGTKVAKTIRLYGPWQ